MKRDTLDRLVELVTKAGAPQPMDSGDARSKTFVVNGEVIERFVEPAPRRHDAGTLGDLIRLANRFAADGGEDDYETAGDASPVVWYSEDSVDLVIDDRGHRLETVKLPLDFSGVFQVVRRLRETQAWFEQKAFVRLLRIDLAGALDPVHLLNAVRSVKFESGSVTRGEVQKSRESIGREIISRVEPSAELPDEVTLRVPVFKTAGLREVFPVRCAVDVNPPEGKFQLLPLPDEIERAIADALAFIGAVLGDGLDESVPHYQGRP